MGEDGGLKIVKVGGDPTPAKVGGKEKKTRKQLQDKKPKFGILKGGRTARAKPRFEAVRDPAKAPPLKKTGRIRILTEKGEAERRRRIAAKARREPIGKIRETLRKHNLRVREHTPDKLTRRIYEDAQEAGMISSD